jgi:hypothetical protein
MPGLGGGRKLGEMAAIKAADGPAGVDPRLENNVYNKSMDNLRQREFPMLQGKVFG